MYISVKTLSLLLLLHTTANATSVADSFSSFNLTTVGLSSIHLISGLKNDKAAPVSYIVRLRPGASFGKRDTLLDVHDHFHKRANDMSISYSTNFEYKNPKVFYGLSIKVNNFTDLAKIENFDSVSGVYPVQSVPRPEPVTALSGSHHELTKRFNPNVNSPLQMTGVDKLHRRGIKGKGMRIAVIDTGIDYTLKALGGCFGKGCKVSFGYDLVGDDFGDTGIPVPDADPLDSCEIGGHGTHVSGIIGMDEKDGEGFGLQGVAPKAELGMYRIFGCGNSGTQTDIMIAAIDMAAKEKPDLISMSVGGFQPWQNLYAFDPLLETIDNVVATGVGFVAAAGNAGDEGVFTMNSPGVARNAIGVAYVENSQWQTVYTATDSLGNTIHTASLSPIQNATDGLEIILLGNGTVASQQNCDGGDAYAEAASRVTGFKNVALAIRRGGKNQFNQRCSMSYQVELAQEAGFNSFMILPDTTNSDRNYLGYVLPEPVRLLDGSLMRLFSISADAAKVFDGLSKSDPYKLFFKETSHTQEAQINGGFIGNYSSIGPAVEFTIKPDIAAPGGSILATYPSNKGGYAALSGTSMAAPHIAGVYALVKSQNPSLLPADVHRILQTSTTHVKNIYQPDVVESVAAQGGGMINAFTAVSNTFTLSPSKMELFGIESLTVKNFTISNPSNAEVTYEIAHDPAGLMYYNPDPATNGWSEQTASGIPSLPIYAELQIKTKTVTIPAGQSSTLQVTFEAPKGLNESQIPIYSGFISVTSPTEVHSIPYLGLAYDLHSAKYLQHGQNNGKENMAFAHYNNDSETTATGFLIQNFTEGGMLIRFSNFQPTQLARFDIVPANTTFIPDFYGYDSSVKYNTTHNPAVTETVAGLDIVGTCATLASWGPVFQFSFTWQGYIRNGNDLGNERFVPIGDYRLVIRFLRAGGDKNKEKDYQSWMSGILSIV